MTIARGPSNVQQPLNISGSSTFGVYPKISNEKTYNMYISDNWMIDYGGYLSIIKDLGINGRGIFTSTILDRMIAIIGNKVYLLDIIFNQTTIPNYMFNPLLIGSLETFVSNVYISENNAGQVAISDGSNIYIYDPNSTNSFRTFTSTDLGFVPGYISFHDTYFLCAASQDTFFSPPASNSWRLSDSNDGTSWPADAAHIGLIETKPTSTQVVSRFPGGGNMILVMGTTVSEPWFDVGYQLFPYQRNTSSNIDYGTGNPASYAYNEDMAVWLGQNEKSGPVIMSFDGGNVRRITTDGIDNLLSNLTNPNDCSAFMYRHIGHNFYHINFYTDNISLFYDFNTSKFYHACDENQNYFIAKQVAFFRNQYYFVSKNNGNVYAFDIDYDTYDGAEIPRIRICKSIRMSDQDYFVVNDCGFTMEQGTTEPQYQNLGPANLTTESGNLLITENDPTYLLTENGEFLITENGIHLITEDSSDNSFDYLITEEDILNIVYPRVDLTISTDGGESFGNTISYETNALGHRVNMLRFWQLGVANDWTAQFRFWGMSRFVATDGVANIRM